MGEFDINVVKNPEVYEQNRLAPCSDHVCYANAQEEEKQQSSLRASLNGKWFFHYAKNFALMPQGFENDSFDVSGWDMITVPGHFETQGYGHPHYTNIAYPWDGKEQIIPGQIPTKFNPVGSYVTFFERNSAWENCFICFEGVDSAYAVYLNGHYVGYATGSFTPSMFDLTPYMREGSNRLAVRVFKYSSGSFLEDQDYWRLSGIFRPVYIFTKPAVHLEDIFVKASLEDDYKTPVLTGTVRLNNPGTVVFALRDHDAQGCIATLDVNSSNTDTEFSLDVSKLSIDPWSAEEPNLYNLTIQVVPTGKANKVSLPLSSVASTAEIVAVCDEFDQVATEFVHLNVGFRRFEMINKIMHINGKRIVFNGVNRHEFSAKTGRTVSYEETYFDLLTIKRNNINAVRTCHYPNSSCLYDICDRIGLYVIDETNLETHHTWQKYGEVVHNEYTLPDGHPEWRDAVLARAQAMLERDKNHACIIIWSCGNESYGGKTLFEMHNYFKERDPSRLVHYENLNIDDRYPDTTDMYSTMYAHQADIEEYLKTHTEKPYILCEYSHAMGQSCGGLKVYTDYAKREPRYQGGFIWDYKDQAFFVKNEYGEEYYAYGGDFNDYPTDYNFSGNGIAFADCSETGKMPEVKFNYQNFELIPQKDHITVKNYSLFTNADKYVFSIHLLANGVEVNSIDASIEVEPGQTLDVPYDYDALKRQSDLTTVDCTNGVEYVVEATLSLAEDEEWADAGYEIAFGQAVIETEQKCCCCKCKAEHNLELVTGHYIYGVHGTNFSALFSKSKGGLVSLVVNGSELLKGTPYLNFWRAPTDNDRGNFMPNRTSAWKCAGIFAKPIEHSATVEQDCVKVCFKHQLATLPIEAFVDVVYSVYQDGTIKVDLDYKKADGLPNEIPEFGMIFPLAKDFDELEYYGRGVDANYVDRKEGYKLGAYLSTVDAEYENYLRPQECGNHTDVRYFKVQHKALEHGLVFRKCDDFLNVSALHWNPEQLENALHPHELPDPFFTYVKLSAQMTGIGGDDSWGSTALDQYIIKNQDLHFSFVIKGY